MIILAQIYRLVSFTNFKSYSKNQDHMTYDGKFICTFVVLPHKPRFQTKNLNKDAYKIDNVAFFDLIVQSFLLDQLDQVCLKRTGPFWNS